MCRLDNKLKKIRIWIKSICKDKNEIVTVQSIYSSFSRLPDREVEHAYSRNTVASARDR